MSAISFKDSLSEALECAGQVRASGSDDRVMYVMQEDKIVLALLHGDFDDEAVERMEETLWSNQDIVKIMAKWSESFPDRHAARLALNMAMLQVCSRSATECRHQRGREVCKGEEEERLEGRRRRMIVELR